MTRAVPLSHDEKYRLERTACTAELSHELIQLTREIDDPILKLKWLRGAIDRHHEGTVELLPCAPARRAWYRLRGLDVLHRVLRTDGESNPALVERVRLARLAARRSIGVVIVAILVLIPALFAGMVINVNDADSVRLADARSSSSAVAASGAAADEPTNSVSDAEPTRLEPVAETLPEEELGLVPTTIWLADTGADWELYSNGLRIETKYTVRGKERNYLVHHRENGAQRGVRTKPVGIVFHTSESDLWPLEEDFQRELRTTSSALLRYLQRAQAYNYLIDRFGRVYRLVEDDTRANHAGRSVWARNDDVYLDLNSAFLGVSFESRWEGGRTLPITRAQLIAGRNLTHYLRQRFAIAPEMCVTHGLTSVNAKAKLIGYHLDWARGFPFEAFGLPNLYARPTPSVAVFGFGYDDEFLKTVGEPWPGLHAANELLEREARERGQSVAALRRERQARYEKWLQDSAADASVAREKPLSKHIDTRG